MSYTETTVSGVFVRIREDIQLLQSAGVKVVDLDWILKRLDKEEERLQNDLLAHIKAVDFTKLFGELQKTSPKELASKVNDMLNNITKTGEPVVEKPMDEGTDIK